MNGLTHTLSDGKSIFIHLKRSARTNLILRPIDADTVSINIPPRFSLTALKQWLAANETVLRNTLAKAPAHTAPSLPDTLLFHGKPLALRVYGGKEIILMPSEIRLPDGTVEAQTAQLRRFLQQQAHDYLIPRLHSHAQHIQLFPTAAALSNAKTFWGICRRTTGIRLNWRLVGAPEYVADYVCIHELCHLAHMDHSDRFWTLTRTHAPYTDDAKQWLKTHGTALFALG